MPAYVALLRGINVGARNRILMKDLTVLMEGLDCKHVKTYIQTGNIVFTHALRSREKLAANIRESIQERFHFTPRVMIVLPKEIKDAVEHNPYPTAAANRLHFYFLETLPGDIELELFDALKRDSEEYSLLDKVFYLHTPEGMAKSKVAAKVEKVLGVSATARNL
mmetsp:Transcript_15488/g.19725  ORF Transcript_15488/g.19725 Transcript_15488/m.19725 type:complete len:165 (+) Transcript_15488:79-573(+)